MDIREVATIKHDVEGDKVVVAFNGVDKQKLEELVTECSSGVCSCGSEAFLANVDAFVLTEDGKNIEISGKISAEEVAQTLSDWQKDL